MQQGRLAEAGAVIGPESGTPPHTAAAIYRSSAPGDDLVLAVQKVIPRRSTVDTKDEHRWIVTPAEWAIFQSGIPAAPSVTNVESG